MPNDSHIRDKTKEQILMELCGTAMPGSDVHEQQKMGILVRCVEDLERRLESQTDALLTVNQHLTFHMEGLKDLTVAAQETVKESLGSLTQATVEAQVALKQSVDALTQATVASSEGSDRLGRKLVALNWILAIATGLGALAGLASAIAAFRG